MAGRVAIDTSFLIDLQRERRGGASDGPATHFLHSDPSLELFLPATVLGEFAEGFDTDDHPLLRAVRELHSLLPLDEATALRYARITRELRSRGALIGTNDLWIAACCLQHDVPLVTANVVEFRRVRELEVVAYR